MLEPQNSPLLGINRQPFKEHGQPLVRMLDGALGRPDSFGLNALTAKEFDDPLWDDEEPESEVIYTSEADATSRSTATNASQPISASDVHRPIAPKMASTPRTVCLIRFRAGCSW